MANIANISKTPDSHLRENIPTAIFLVAKLCNFRWQYTSECKACDKNKTAATFRLCGCNAAIAQ